jgi:uncharacterized membrane protein
MSDHTMTCTPEPGPVFFDATLHPNRSLSPSGFRILMVIAGISVLAIGILFVVAGAWPVFGFSGAEFLLLYIAFRLNYRSGRAYERVRLTDRQLEVMRVSPGGEVGRWEFEPTWLQISMDNPPRHDSQLRLSSHGRSLVIGAFLTPAERVEVADALRDAIADWRNRWSRAFVR